MDDTQGTDSGCKKCEPCWAALGARSTKKTGLCWVILAGVELLLLSAEMGLWLTWRL